MIPDIATTTLAIRYHEYFARCRALALTDEQARDQLNRAQTWAREQPDSIDSLDLAWQLLTRYGRPVDVDQPTRDLQTIMDQLLAEADHG